VDPIGRPHPAGSALSPRPNASQDLARRKPPAARQAATRQLILDTAERLFVEQGVLTVSSRQIGEAADYGNDAVFGYHFGTSADLVRAIARRFTADVERSRVSMLAELDEPAGVRDWLACMVLPWTDHFAARGPHSYYARLCAQALSHPSLRDVIAEEAIVSPSLQQTLAALSRYLPLMASNMAIQRSEIMEYAIVHTCAERERALADGTPTPRKTWRDAAGGLVDALVGIWTAPVTASPRRLAPREWT
jgi:AcrR family transcriptional regulator